MSHDWLLQTENNPKWANWVFLAHFNTLHNKLQKECTRNKTPNMEKNWDFGTKTAVFIEIANKHQNGLQGNLQNTLVGSTHSCGWGKLTAMV